MKFCSLSKLSLLLAAVLHVAFNTLSAAELRQEEERQRLAIILHSRQSSLPYHGGFAFKNVHGSTHSDALQRISKAVEGTKARTGALKRGIRGHHHHHPNGKESYVEALYPRSYGGYSISVSVGTPPQKLSVIMDTGSDLVWMPCTNNYTCIDCPAHTRHSKPLVFHPRNSSSVKRVSCSNPKCKAIGRNTIDRNSTEDLCSKRGKCSGRNPKKCSAALCPAYGYEYGSGLTLGFLVSDTLTLALKNGGKREIKHFGVGCSLISTRPPYGIAGFGRGDLSLPSQLSSVIGDKFGYCLLNQVYEDQNQSSIMLLGNDAVPKGVHLNYTAFLLNTANRAYDSYYYVGLRGISIGKKRLKLPSELLRFDPKGHGGTIVDSGTTFSYLREEIFKEIVGAFDSQVGHSRASALEAETGFGLCYNVSGQETVSVPGFTFHFKGGSHMSLPIENYFLLAEDAICLAMVSIHHSAEDGIGPAVILGNQQQQDFYMLYDREKNRLGFTQQTCKPFG